LLYDVPFFKGSSSWLTRNVIGNWEIAPDYTYQSGQWVTPQSGVDSNLNGDSAPDRVIFNASGTSDTGSVVTPLCNSSVASCPATVAAAKKTPAGVVGYLAADPSARYIEAGYGARATSGRSLLQLDPINNVDLTLIKRFSFREHYGIEFQCQAFNVLNHPQYVGGFLNDVAPLGFTGSERNMLLVTNPSFNRPQDVFSSNSRTLQLVFKFKF